MQSLMGENSGKSVDSQFEHMNREVVSRKGGVVDTAVFRSG